MPTATTETLTAPSVEPYLDLQLPEFYVNAAVNGISTTEINSVLMFGNKPLAILNMTPTMAKSYAQALLGLVQTFEAISGQTVLTIDQLRELMDAHKAGDIEGAS